MTEENVTNENIHQDEIIDLSEPTDIELGDNVTTVIEEPTTNIVEESSDITQVEDVCITSSTPKTLKENPHVTVDIKYKPEIKTTVKGSVGVMVDDELNPYAVDFLSLPNETISDLKSLEYTAKKDLQSQTRTAQGTLWASDVSRSSQYYNVDDRFDSSTTRENSEWKQSLDFEGKATRGGENSLGKFTPKLDGKQAVKAIRASCNLSNTITKPLYNSGIWISIDAPSDVDLLNLDRNISQHLNDFGYATMGLVYSNEMVYINKMVVDLAIKYISHSSLIDHNEVNLRKVISVHDIGLLAVYLGLLSYPNGYKTRRPCLNNPKTCTHVAERLMDLRNIIYIDNNRLSHEDKRFVTNPTKKRTVEEVLEYQQSVNSKTSKNVFTINDKMKVILQTPQMEGYENNGIDWINNINSIVDGSATRSKREREEAIMDFARISKARNYSHYIKEIVITINDEESVIDDPEAIKDAITELSGVIVDTTPEGEDVTAVDRIIDKIGEYIDDATVVVIAIAKYACRACGVLQSDGYDKHPDLITFDPVRVFFTLVGRKLEKVT